MWYEQLSDIVTSYTIPLITEAAVHSAPEFAKQALKINVAALIVNSVIQLPSALDGDAGAQASVGGGVLGLVNPYAGILFAIFGEELVLASRETPPQPHFFHNTAGCFVEGTKVTMSDGTYKEIQNVVIGDYVKSYDVNKAIVEINVVLELEVNISSNLLQITFDNDNANINTTDHPYYIIGKGWCSYDPELTYENYTIKVKKIEVGDVCLFLDGDELMEVKIESLIQLEGAKKTYNLHRVESNNNFFANGMLVHNKYDEN